ncbi:hypothetical protein ACH347_34935 [Saccharopolyspora sp. 5N102]|uniref:hypothetical protein n=1 Tax=Saccharopolyspora sp. 5N102 TaxID=3375155 RepID=UPI003790EE61
MIENLPPGGAFARARGDGWTDLEHLVANVIDAVQGSAYSVVGALGAKPKKPKPQRRPGDQNPDRIGDRGGQSTEDVVAYLDSLKPAAA